MGSNLRLQEGWPIIQNEMSKLINTLEGVPDSPNYGSIYSTVYTMCKQSPPFDECKGLYSRYEGVYEEYLKSKVLPAIQEKKNDDVSMLQEFVKSTEEKLLKQVPSQVLPESSQQILEKEVQSDASDSDLTW
ncbi:cullin-1-like [Papaver somniferum]|uniref:cullin-1-like n=1 Tax=Papaver somniferum TaxID=3469 RepID=UPI000E70052C|nr:cullin-1-like [Papaver somniferum]XP_026408670.1 cullin-1-like [Papaver somniferum]XP_026408671.1 cullin-1-like [Papaver somniferum]